MFLIKKIKIAYLVMFTVVFIVSISGTCFASSIVNPSRYIFNVEPGVDQNGTIKVTNTGTEEVEFQAVLYDWFLNADNSFQSQESNTLPDTLYGMIKFNPRSFTLRPGETQIVRFTIKIPENIEPKERKGVVFFEQEKTKGDYQIGANVVTQVGTTIYIIPSTAQVIFQILFGKIVQLEGEIMGGIIVANKGTAHSRYTVKYNVINSQGILIEEGQLDEEVLLPGMQRVVGIPFKNPLTSDQYNLMVTIEFAGTDQSLNYIIPFEIPLQE